GNRPEACFEVSTVDFLQAAVAPRDLRWEDHRQIAPLPPLLRGHLEQHVAEGQVGDFAVPRMVRGEPLHRITPPALRPAGCGYLPGFLKAPRLHQVAHELPDDPAIAGNRRGRTDQLPQQAFPRVRHRRLLRWRLPLSIVVAGIGEAETPDPLIAFAPAAAPRPRKVRPSDPLEGGLLRSRRSVRTDGILPRNL